MWYWINKLQQRENNAAIANEALEECKYNCSLLLDEKVGENNVAQMAYHRAKVAVYARYLPEIDPSTIPGTRDPSCVKTILVSVEATTGSSEVTTRRKDFY
jgi:hypothetical protein